MATRLDRFKRNHILPGAEAQKRYRQRMKFKLVGAELTRMVERKFGLVDPARARKLNNKIDMALKLPHRWDEEDLQRSARILQAVEGEVLAARRKRLLKVQGLEEQLYEDFYNSEGTTEEKLAAVRAFCESVNEDFKLVDQTKMKDNEENLLLLLLLGRKYGEFPSWFVDSFVKFIVRHLPEQEVKAFSDKLSKEIVGYEQSLSDMQSVLRHINIGNDENE